MRILITGGAGFIGRQLVREVVAEGHVPVVLDSLRPDVHPDPDAIGRAIALAGELGAELIVADVRDGAALALALAGVDAVAHLAAKVGLGVDLGDLDDYVSSNDLGTAVLLQAMARSGTRRLVLAGSMVVYGEGAYSCSEHGAVSPGPLAARHRGAGGLSPRGPVWGRALHPALVAEDAVPDPRNGYAATKLHQEHLCSVWARETGGTVASMRFHNVYGPGMPRDTPYAGVAAIFRSALAAGRAPNVLEDGRQRRDFVHVSDVARAVLAALRLGGSAPAFRAYNVGSGQVGTIGGLATSLAEVMAGPAPVVTGGYRLGDVRHITACSERAGRELGWRARVSLADGLREFATG